MANKVIIGNIRGKQGVIGNTPNISAEITGLPAGSTPTVERSGSNDNPILTFGIPATDQGVVVVFTVNRQRTDASTDADFNNIYELLQNNENVKFVAQDRGDIYELSYALEGEQGNTPAIYFWGVSGATEEIFFGWNYYYGVVNFHHITYPLLKWSHNRKYSI